MSSNQDVLILSHDLNVIERTVLSPGCRRRARPAPPAPAHAAAVRQRAACRRMPLTSPARLIQRPARLLIFHALCPVPCAQGRRRRAAAPRGRGARGARLPRGRPPASARSWPTRGREPHTGPCVARARARALRACGRGAWQQRHRLPCTARRRHRWLPGLMPFPTTDPFLIYVDIYCAAPQDKGERRDDKAAGLARHRAVGALLADLHILETVALYKTPRPESRFTNPFPPRRSTKPQEQKRLGCAARAAMRPLLMRGSPHLAGGLAPRACLALIRPPRAGDPLNDSPVARQATRPSGRVQPALRPGGVERAAGCLAQQRDVSIYGTQCLRSDVSALRRYRGKARAALIRP
jgi:hypothetical protein